MGHLGVYSTIVPAASQKEISHGTGLLWIILKLCHHSNKYFYASKFYTSIYIEISTAQRAYIRWHNANYDIFD